RTRTLFPYTTLFRSRRRGVAFAGLAAGELDVDAGIDARGVEAQAAGLDPEPAQLQRLAIAVVGEAEVPVARAALGIGFKAHVGCVQPQFGQPHPDRKSTRLNSS